MEQREIKFRGFRKDNNELVCGSLSIEFDGSYHIVYWVNKLLEPENNYWEPVCEWHEVKPETVGQYTGLKDKNGKEIYEGDKDKSGGVIMWSKKHALFCLHYYQEYFNRWAEASYPIDNERIEIVGNIYESETPITDLLTND